LHAPPALLRGAPPQFDFLVLLLNIDNIIVSGLGLGPAAITIPMQIEYFCEILYEKL
jgi:hypothetical protein